MIGKAWAQFPQFPVLPQTVESFFDDLKTYTLAEVTEAVSRAKVRSVRTFPVNSSEVIEELRKMQQRGNPALRIVKAEAETEKDVERAQAVIDEVWEARPELKQFFKGE